MRISHSAVSARLADADQFVSGGSIAAGPHPPAVKTFDDVKTLKPKLHVKFSPPKHKDECQRPQNPDRPVDVLLEDDEINADDIDEKGHPLDCAHRVLT